MFTLLFTIVAGEKRIALIFSVSVLPKSDVA